jgi:hypothetical protein
MAMTDTRAPAALNAFLKSQENVAIPHWRGT